MSNVPQPTLRQSSRAYRRWRAESAMHIDDDRLRVVRRAALAILTDVDPMGLAPGQEDGAPADEYTAEADDLARLRLSHDRVTVDAVDMVWMHWFGEPLAPETSALIAQSVGAIADSALH